MQKKERLIFIAILKKSPEIFLKGSFFAKENEFIWCRALSRVVDEINHHGLYCILTILNFSDRFDIEFEPGVSF